MAQQDRFFIGPFDNKSGLQRNVKPFMITDDAFASLNNAYAWRGRIRKRFGSRWLGDTQQSTRLRVLVATTDGSGDASDMVPALAGSIGQLFSVGNNIFTVNALGTPANLLISGTATTATFNTSSGAFVFTGTDANEDVYWYPALPVMGMATFQNTAINNEPLIAFDTQYAYQYAGGGWNRIAGEATPGAATWSGDNSQFFWFTTYNGVNAYDYALFVTNFNEAEPNYMRFLFNNQWDNFRPQVSTIAGPTNVYMDAARILVPFKNRLLAFNIWENDGTQRQYANRMRYSQVGSPLDTNAWRDDIPGRGGGADCPTNEAIVTVEFVKDRLIVFLEQSTWEIAYTGNQQSPFVWQQINTELGVESTFSVVPFDKVAIGVGNVGVMACTGTNVDRIDDKIPDEVFKIHNSDQGVERVYGIRDYYVEMIYWTFPDPQATATFPFPNKVLVYNYKNNTWSFNDDSITAFGYFQPSPVGTMWSSLTVDWESDETWDDGSLQALFRQVAAGNQEGWTFIIDAESSFNCPALQITDITISVPGSNQITITSIDHNLRFGDYVYISEVTGSGNLNLLNGKIFKVNSSTLSTPNSFQITYDIGVTVIAGTYTGGGVLSRVSQIQLLTKQYNFYMDQGRNSYVSKVDFLVDRTEFGQVQIDFFVSTADNSMLSDSNTVTGTGSLLGSGSLETFPYATIPFEQTASQLWHPYYLQADGEFIQLNIQLNDAQMRDDNIRKSQFQLHSMLFHTTPTSARLQ
jgi:hypothetical protein